MMPSESCTQGCLIYSHRRWSSPNFFLVYWVYLNIVVWGWDLRSCKCDFCHILYVIFNIVSHILFYPNKGANLFGGLGELIFCLPWVCKAVDVGQSVMIIQTILFSLEYLSDWRGYLMVTLVASTTTTTNLESLSVYSSRTSSVGWCVQGRHRLGITYCPGVWSNVLWTHLDVTRGIARCWYLILYPLTFWSYWFP